MMIFLAAAHGATFTLCGAGCDFNGSATNAVNSLSGNDELEIIEAGTYDAALMNFSGSNIRIVATVPGVILSNAQISSVRPGMQFEGLTLDCGGTGRLVTLSSSSSLSLDFTHVANCSSPVEGGGVVRLTHNNASVSIRNSWIHNVSSSNGAVIYQDRGSVTMENSLVCSAVAAGGGGVLYRDSFAGSALLRGNLFVQTAANEGGVIRNGSGGLVYDHNTALGSGATAAGAVIHFDQRGADVSNSLFAHSLLDHALSGGVPTGVYGWNGWWANNFGDVEGGGLGADAQNTNPDLPVWGGPPPCDPSQARPGNPVYVTGAQGGAEIGFYGNHAGLDAWSDSDGDGQMAIFDCDDQDGTVQRDAIERCDGIDNDCDGLVDEGLFFPDGDLDGYGDAMAAGGVCQAGWVGDNTDCDDLDPLISPAAPEQCDDIDNDCDTEIDEDLVFIPYYPDVDGDGVGALMGDVSACAPPVGTVDTTGDCDDSEPLAYPGNVELCDGIDNDCVNGIPADEVDGDGDGFSTCLGDCDDTNEGRFPGADEGCDLVDTDCDGVLGADELADLDSDGAVACLDCDDNNPAMFPGGTEVCDGLDNDCVGGTDDGLLLPIYADADGDGVGVGASTGMACELLPGFASSTGDCDDTDPNNFPLNGERCDGEDNDCDEEVDEGLPTQDFFEDGDLDGFGSVLIGNSCSNPGGAVTLGMDCDDGDPSIFPGAPELCDGVDNNCMGGVDEDLPQIESFEDLDSDGFGGASAGSGCSIPVGNVAEGTDCDDNDPVSYPNAPEICDGVDNDCDGEEDEDALAINWYADLDGDSFGDSVVVTTDCAVQPGLVTNGDDCDDGDPEIRPTGAEVCNGVDDDCDGDIDDADEEVEAPLYYVDDDLDGFGWDMAVGEPFCDPPPNYAVSRTDCDDQEVQINPTAVEACSDGIDNDCDSLIDAADPDYTIDGAVYWYDGDGDGVGAPNPSTDRVFCSNDIDLSYVPPTLGEDCRDDEAFNSPLFQEVCDGFDNNCDGVADEGFVTETWFEDSDDDGYGELSLDYCEGLAPPGWVVVGGDCDDENSDVNPGQSEVCDAVDNDCNGTVDDGLIFDYWHVDADGDGFGNTHELVAVTCDGEPDFPMSVVDNNSDCDDADASVNPLADEVCDGIDNDCVPGNEPQAVDYWPDADDDGSGDAEAQADRTCAPEPGWVTNNRDCDDQVAGENCDVSKPSASGCSCSARGHEGAWVFALAALVTVRRVRDRRCA